MFEAVTDDEKSDVEEYSTTMTMTVMLLNLLWFQNLLQLLLRLLFLKLVPLNELFHQLLALTVV